MNDEDLGNTIAYLKTLPAVDAVIPAKRIGPVARALYLKIGFPLIPAEIVPTRFMTDDEIHAVWLYVQSVPSKKTKGS